MTQDLFTQRLHELINRRPFQPFVVELLDGRSIVIDHPAMGFNGNAASFLSETDGLVDFSHDEVRRIDLHRQEALP